MKTVKSRLLMIALLVTVLLTPFDKSQAQHRISIGPIWTGSMLGTIKEVPFKNQSNSGISLNIYSFNWNGHFMYGAKNTIQTLHGFNISKKSNVDLFFFSEENLNSGEGYLSLGLQKACRLGDCEDFFIIFGEIGTDFSEPMINIGITILPQLILWKR